MKKLIVVTLLVVVAGSASAANHYWFGTNAVYYSTGGDGENWESVGNWHNETDFSTLPGGTDDVWIDDLMYDAYSPGTMPTLSSDAGSVASLHIAHIANGASSGQLTIDSSGMLAVSGETYIGNINTIFGADAIGMLNMTGGSLDAGTYMHVGMNWTGGGYFVTGNAVINMSGDAALTVDGLEFAQLRPDYDAGNPDLDGTGYLYITGNATLIIEAGWDSSSYVQTWIDNDILVATGAGESISYSYDGLGTTTVSVIPEPAAFGLLAVFGGGILAIRKKFMI